MELAQRLVAAGFGAKEAAIYLAVAQLGSAGVADIARTARIKRPTAYGLLEALVGKGAIAAGAGARGRTYSVEPPRRLLDLPRQQEATLRDLLPELLALCDIGGAQPRIRVHEGREGIMRVNEDLLTVRSGEYRYIGASRDIADGLSDAYLEDYVKRRVAAGIRSWAIRIRSREVPLPFLADGERWMRRVRLLDEPVSGDIVGLYIYDQRIGIVSTLREGYGMVIESPQLVTLMTMMWRALWAVAKPP